MPLFQRGFGSKCALVGASEDAGRDCVQYEGRPHSVLLARRLPPPTPAPLFLSYLCLSFLRLQIWKLSALCACAAPCARVYVIVFLREREREREREGEVGFLKSPMSTPLQYRERGRGWIFEIPYVHTSAVKRERGLCTAFVCSLGLTNTAA